MPLNFFLVLNLFYVYSLKFSGKNIFLGFSVMKY